MLKKITLLSTFFTILLSSQSLAKITSTFIVSSEGLVRIRVKDKLGFADRKGNVIIKPEFHFVDFFSDNLSAAYNDDYQCGYINKQGKYAIKPNFALCYPFKEGIASVTFVTNEKDEIVKAIFSDKAVLKLKKGEIFRKGFIDKKGNFIYKTKPYSSDTIGRFSEGVGAIYTTEINSKKRKTFYIDRKGKITFQPKENSVAGFYEDLAIFKINNKVGYINKKDQIIIKPIYDDGGYFSEGLSPVKIKNKYGFIDKTGKVIISPKFDKASSFSDGLSRITINKKIGYADKKGKIVIKPQFSSASDFSEGLAEVSINKKFFIINKKSEIQKSFPEWDFKKMLDKSK